MNGGSVKPESTASAMRRARVTDKDLSEVWGEIQALATTMGAVSLRFVELQKEAKIQNTQAEGVRRESLGEMKALVNSGKSSFDAMARMVETDLGKVEGQLWRLDRESELRTRQDKWKTWAISLLVVSTSSFSAWGGWTWHERWRADNPSSQEVFVTYLMANYPKDTTTYWKRFQEKLSANAKKTTPIARSIQWPNFRNRRLTDSRVKRSETMVNQPAVAPAIHSP